MATHVLELPAHTPPKAQDIIVRQRSMIDNLKAAGEEAATRTLRTVEVGVGAATLGYIEGRYQMEEINGIPLAATAGVAFHAAAFYVGGPNAEHLHNFGDAGIAAQGYKTGLDMGKQMRIKANETKQPAAFPP
jgi:hypothetical protein